MKKLTDKTWWAKAGTRAIKTVAQSLGSMLPVGFIVTPVMIEEASWTMVYVLIAWIATGLLSGLASLLTSIAGLPEMENDSAEILYDGLMEGDEDDVEY